MNARYGGILLLKVGVTALILALFVRQFDLRSIAQTLSTISGLAVLAAVVTLLAQSLVAAARLAMIVAHFGTHFALAPAWSLTLEGMFFSQTFISFLGGDALRIWRIRGLGLELPKATSAVVLDRIVGTVVNHVFLLGSVPWLLGSNADRSVKLILVALAVAGVVGFLLVLLLGYMRGRIGIVGRLPPRFRARIVTLILDASTVGHHLLGGHRRLIWIFLLSCLITIANMLVFAVVLYGMGVALPLAIGCALLVPAIMEIAMLPISLAGWGVREGAAVVAFGALGLPAEQALGASLEFGLLLAAVSLIGGVLWLRRRGRE